MDTQGIDEDCLYKEIIMSEISGIKWYEETRVAYIYSNGWRRGINWHH